MKSYEELFAFFEEHLKQQEFDTRHSELYRPIQYTLHLGGKRIRPVLTLMACDIFGGKLEDALPQAIAIELFHNFTLIHDDIMDNAPLRRGRETVFKKWDTNIAILSGDTLFALAYRYAQQAELQKLPAILNVFNKTAIEVCEGQQFDLLYETKNDLTVDQYIQMIKLKTAVLFGASLKIGALVGGASEQDAENLYQFGLHVGMGFQLKDDLLDTFGDELIFGKKTGTDIITNKKTYLYLKAKELADPATRERLEKLYTEEFDHEEKFKEVKNIFTSLEVDRWALEIIKDYLKVAEQSLEKITLDDDTRNKLLSVARRMIERDK